jgi:glutamyl-Q tRNA(Asp) synthetase
MISRFAPSPTGRLHLGHAFSAVLGHQRAQATGGKFLLRIEDLDQTRSRPEFVDAIVADLRWLGLDWDRHVIVQSQRTAAYDDALETLKARGLVYACTCRRLPDDPQRRASTAHCWRLDSAKALQLAGLPGWTEADGTSFTAGPEQIGDAILARKDAPASYHLACVVDDAASGVTMVVRGADLRPSTPTQRLLQLLLGLPEPTYLHHPLVTHAGGRRLAKRNRAPTLAAMREADVDGSALARDLLDGKLPLGFDWAEA